MSLQEGMDFNQLCKEVTSSHKPLILTWNKKTLIHWTHLKIPVVNSESHDNFD